MTYKHHSCTEQMCDTYLRAAHERARVRHRRRVAQKMHRPRVRQSWTKPLQPRRMMLSIDPGDPDGPTIRAIRDFAGRIHLVQPVSPRDTLLSYRKGKP